MRKISSSSLNEILEGKLIRGNGKAEASDVVIDSRETGPDKVFFALKGEKNDGHNYLRQVFGSGCRIVVVSDLSKVEEALSLGESDCEIILVSDTKASLQKLSAWYLDSLDLKVRAAVTGSVGKTSTRDFMYYVLSEKYRTARSIKNYNNSFGLPLSILSFPEDTEAAVIEMGMDGKGSIAVLDDIVRPDTAVITNVGVSHLENFPEEGRMGILNTKLEITGHFKDDSTLVINASNDLLSEVDMKERGIKGSMIKVGTEPECDYSVSEVKDNGIDGISFRLTHDGETYDVELPVPGAHNAINAALAVAVGVRYGLTVEEAIEGFRKTELTEKRLTLKERDGIKVIDDTYNAAPDSVKSAINTLMATPVPEGGRHILITGDMGELGAERANGHRSVGEYAFESGVDVMIAIGEASVETIYGWKLAAETAGHSLKAVNATPIIIMDETTGQGAEHFPDKEMVVNGVRDHIKAGDCVLVKASRFMQLEKIVKRLIED